MAVRPPRTLLLPAAGFVALLGLAFLAMARADARPVGRLYRTAAGYLSDVAGGRADGAAARAAPAGRTYAAEEAHRRAGQVWTIGGLETRDDGRLGVVRVLWFQADGRFEAEFVQSWARQPDGGWELVGEQRAGP